MIIRDDPLEKLPPRRHDRNGGHYAATTAGFPFVDDWFDYAAHDAYVEQGHCPVVEYNKQWCAGGWTHATAHHRGRGPRL